MAASPLTEDGSGFKESMDECCWTPLNLSLPLETYTFVEVISYHFLALQPKKGKKEIPTKTQIYEGYVWFLFLKTRKTLFLCSLKIVLVF